MPLKHYHLTPPITLPYFNFLKLTSINTSYLFQSPRLGFRDWLSTDIDKMAAISANEKVMEFFPAPATKEQTVTFIERMQNMYAEKGFCYFAVDTLANNEFIGFIGLCEQTYEADFTPCIDIGWRLSPHVWNMGYATEGAKQCLEYAFNNLDIETIYSTAPIVNVKSQHIMIKIGLTRLYEFDHPRLIDYERLKRCVLYEKQRNKTL